MQTNSDSYALRDAAFIGIKQIDNFICEGPTCPGEEGTQSLGTSAYCRHLYTVSLIKVKAYNGAKINNFDTGCRNCFIAAVDLLAILVYRQGLP